MTLQRGRRVVPRAPERPADAGSRADAWTVRLQRTAGNSAVAGLLAAQRQGPADVPDDRILDAAQVRKAVTFYRSRPARYTPEIVGRIQEAVGAPVSGTVDESTVEAVARWQRDHGGDQPALAADGMAGPRTLPRMFTGGLNAPGQAKAYGEEAQTAVVLRWHNLTPAGRAIELVRLVNEHLEAAGVPPVTPNTASLQKGTAGSFDFGPWQMNIDVGALRIAQPTRDEAAGLVDTIYHEARHAEQWFRMAQLRAGQGLSAAAIAEEMAIPPRIATAAKAAPLARGSTEALVAQGWFDSVYGVDRDARGAVLTEATSAAEARKVAQERNEKDPTPANAAALARAQARFDRAFARYQNLPEENDAHALGPQTGAGVTRGAPDPVVPDPATGPGPAGGTPAGALPADGATAIEPLGGALGGLLGEASTGVPVPVGIAP